jgi:hypothetical protein
MHRNLNKASCPKPFAISDGSNRGDIEEPMTWQILERLINHFITIVNEGEQAMVVRKLASSLVAVFRNSASSWKRALWQLAASLAHGGYISESDSQTVDFLTGVLPVLNTQKAIALVFFSVALAEEALRLEAEPQDLVGSVIQRVVENIADAFLLAQYIIRQIACHVSEASSESMESALGNEAMGSWKVRTLAYIRIVRRRLTLILIERPGLVSMETIAIPRTSKPRPLQFHVARI